METDHYLMYVDDKLISAIDGVDESSEAAKFVHSQFRSMVLCAQFPCPGARTAFTQGTYRFGLFDSIGTKETAEALGHSLRNFIKARRSMNTVFTTFVSCYKHPIPLTHEEFAHLLWSMLQELHITDLSEWDAIYSSDPKAPDFAFSYGGLSFFIVGMHSGSPRFARRFGWPTLVFNAHAQFELLRSKGIFEKFQNRVRKQDTDLQGCINPALSDFGSGVSEAIQYTGQIENEAWKCPFQYKHKTGD